MSFHTEYWVTIATVIPVLTLALVVEARGLASRWTLDIRSGRRVQAWVYPPTLLAALVVEMAALDALARGRETLWAAAIASPVVLLMFIVLVIMPAADLWARGNADKLIRAITLGQRRKLRKAGRRIAHAQCRADVAKHVLLDQIGKVRDLTAKLQEHISSRADCDESARDRADMAWCRGAEAALLKDLAEIDEIQGQHEQMSDRVAESEVLLERIETELATRMIRGQSIETAIAETRVVIAATIEDMSRDVHADE